MFCLLLLKSHFLDHKKDILRLNYIKNLQLQLLVLLQFVSSLVIIYSSNKVNKLLHVLFQLYVM